MNKAQKIIAGIAGAGVLSALVATAQPSTQQSDIQPVVQPVTYSDCRTEEIPFATQYEGETGQYGYTETIKQQGVAGSKKICKPSKPGYEDKVEVIAQPVSHVIVRTPKPAPQPVQQQHYRVGAICRDGWRSYATGRGACSHHGGVSEWLYE